MFNKTYSELIRIDSFEDRYEYLKLGGQVGASTFGFDRWVNQEFYTSSEWRQLRNHIIVRDEGCDLGVHGYDIHDGLLIHHINPLSREDILGREDWILDPEFLITTTHETHNALHYGDSSKLRTPFVPRSPGDTKLW